MGSPAEEEGNGIPACSCDFGCFLCDVSPAPSRPTGLEDARCGVVAAGEAPPSPALVFSRSARRRLSCSAMSNQPPSSGMMTADSGGPGTPAVRLSTPLCAELPALPLPLGEQDMGKMCISCNEERDRISPSPHSYLQISKGGVIGSYIQMIPRSLRVRGARGTCMHLFPVLVGTDPRS